MHSVHVAVNGVGTQTPNLQTLPTLSDNLMTSPSTSPLAYAYGAVAAKKLC